MFKKIILILLLISTSKNILAQNEKFRKNSIFIEWPGIPRVISLNYDRYIFFNENFGTTIGIGFSPWSLEYDLELNFPIQTKLFYKSGNHTVDAGLAVTPYVWFNYYLDNGKDKREPNLDYFVAAQIGYNYSFLKNRLFVGVAFTPFIYYYEYSRRRINNGYGFGFYEWGTIRLGFKF